MREKSPYPIHRELASFFVQGIRASWPEKHREASIREEIKNLQKVSIALIEQAAAARCNDSILSFFSLYLPSTLFLSPFSTHTLSLSLPPPPSFSLILFFSVCLSFSLSLFLLLSLSLSRVSARLNTLRAGLSIRRGCEPTAKVPWDIRTGYRTFYPCRNVMTRFCREDFARNAQGHGRRSTIRAIKL